MPCCARQEAISSDEVGETEETKVIERGDLRMDPLRHSVSWKGNSVSLTVTEFLLLQALAQRPGFVKSRDQLMDVAYDDQVTWMIAPSTATLSACVRKCVPLMMSFLRLRPFMVSGIDTTKNDNCHGDRCA